ncbi:MAG: hypothetical protein R6V08_11475 [Desulfuromonadales bacterium]
MNERDEHTVLDRALAARMRKSLTASSEELYQLIQDSSREVLLNALKNPNLAEDHLLTLLKRRDLWEDVPRAIYDSSRIERSHRLQLALAKNPATPTSLCLTILQHLYLFELVDLLCLPGIIPDRKLAVEREITRRLPGVPLGNLITLARRATHPILSEILRLGRPDAVAACLSNPRMKEVGILQFLSSASATPDTISLIGRHSRWGSRPRLQMAILKHPRTPGIWYTLWLPRLKTPLLKELKLSSRLSAGNRALLEREIKKRQRL